MNESKSQQGILKGIEGVCCYKYQNINERKQITTDSATDVEFDELLQISEYQ